MCSLSLVRGIVSSTLVPVNSACCKVEVVSLHCFSDACASVILCNIDCIYI